MIRRRCAIEWRMIASPTDPKHALLPARLVAKAEGFAMVRRARAVPFVVTEEQWADAPVRGS